NLKDEFPIVEETNILSIPEQIRNSDPSFAYQALYKVKNEKFVLQIGTNMVAISSYPKYLGWDEFSATCRKILEVIYNLSIISKVQRIGIRYINQFNGDISKEINVNLNVDNISGKTNIGNLAFNVKYQDTDFSSLIQYRVQSGEILSQVPITIIDIDTSCSLFHSSEIDYIWDRISEGHNVEKRIFFELLKTDYIQKLDPVYE